MDTFYTAEEIASLFKISTYTVLRLIKNGSLSAVKVGAQWRVSQDGLEEFTKRRTLKAKKVPA